MEQKYRVHYYDERLCSHYQCKIVKTANIKAWIGNFEHNNKPYITVMEYELEA